MTQKKISRIRRHTDYSSEYSNAKNDFPFSDDIKVWQGSKTTRVRNKTERETRVVRVTK